MADDHIDEQKGRIGPIPPPGGHALWELWTILDKNELEARIGCSVSYRQRDEWGDHKQVVVYGPPELLKDALRGAMGTLRRRMNPDEPPKAPLPATAAAAATATTSAAPTTTVPPPMWPQQLMWPQQPMWPPQQPMWPPQPMWPQQPMWPPMPFPPMQAPASSSTMPWLQHQPLAGERETIQHQPLAAFGHDGGGAANDDDAADDEEDEATAPDPTRSPSPAAKAAPASMRQAPESLQAKAKTKAKAAAAAAATAEIIEDSPPRSPRSRTPPRRNRSPVFSSFSKLETRPFLTF